MIDVNIACAAIVLVAVVCLVAGWMLRSTYAADERKRLNARHEACEKKAHDDYARLESGHSETVKTLRLAQEHAAAHVCEPPPPTRKAPVRKKSAAKKTARKKL
jgi:low affinity Fe/Cu permease